MEYEIRKIELKKEQAERIYNKLFVDSSYYEYLDKKFFDKLCREWFDLFVENRTTLSNVLNNSYKDIIELDVRSFLRDYSDYHAYYDIKKNVTLIYNSFIEDLYNRFSSDFYSKLTIS